MIQTQYFLNQQLHFHLRKNWQLRTTLHTNFPANENDTIFFFLALTHHITLIYFCPHHHSCVSTFNTEKNRRSHGGDGDSIICGDDKAECQKNMIRSKFK